MSSPKNTWNTKKFAACTNVITSPAGNLVCNCDGKGKKRAKGLDRYLAKHGA